MADGSDSSLSINAVTGLVTLEVAPDHEVQTEFNFTVVVTDTAGNFAERPLTLNVVDVDDVAPLFLSSSNATVDENVGAGQVIYTAEVNDDIDDVSDGVTFKLLPGHDDALSINSVTGEVVLLESPDFEVKKEYSFSILAENNPNLGSVLQVVIAVQNVDDTPPLITSDAVITIDESNKAEQVIYTATADDSADIQTGAITYSLADGHDAALSIDSVSGEVTLASNLDHELQSQFNFVVIATDVLLRQSQLISTI